MNKLTPAMERLLADYQMYVENMRDWKSYHVELIDADGKVVVQSKMLAFNESHLMLEIGQLYSLETLAITSIDFREI